MLKRFGHHVAQHLAPTPHNNFVPHLLREGSIFALLGIGLALFSYIQLARFTGYFGLTAEVYPAVVVTLTNEDRAKHNLAFLSVNPVLEAAAKMKAEDMAQKGYFAHTSPEGLTPWYWFGKAGYSFIYAGENLAINYDESHAVQKAWLNSPTHRANIMNENFSEIGVATATGDYNGKKTTFVVELFGMPATPTKQAPVQPAPQAPAQTTTAQVARAPQEAPLVQKREVAGESVPALTVLEETPDFVIVENTDTALEPAMPVPVTQEHIPFVKRFVLQSDTLAALLIQLIIILAIIATTGMVAREYEKHHKKHMAYGALLAVIMFSSLFVSKIGLFAPAQAGFTASTQSLQEETQTQYDNKW